MTPEQRYFFDVAGYLHLENVLSGDELKNAQEAADRYISMPPEEWPPGFGADLERKDLTGYQHGFAFDKPLEQLAMHPTTWPIMMEFTNYRPRFAGGTLGHNRPTPGATTSKTARSAVPTSSSSSISPMFFPAMAVWW